jgi:hypothetical protein
MVSLMRGGIHNDNARQQQLTATNLCVCDSLEKRNRQQRDILYLAVRDSFWGGGFMVSGGVSTSTIVQVAFSPWGGNC